MLLVVSIKKPEMVSGSIIDVLKQYTRYSCLSIFLVRKKPINKLIPAMVKIAPG